MADVVLSEDTWELPEGVTKSKRYDTYLDVHQNPIDPSSFWKTVTIRILPQTQNLDTFAMVSAGLVEGGPTAVIVLEEDMACLQESFRVLLEGAEFTVTTFESEPAVANEWVRVGLTKWTS